MQETIEFVGLAALADCQNNIVGTDDSDIAMEGLTRMQKNRRSARTSQGRGNFCCNDSGFAESGDNNLSGARGKHCNCVFKFGTQLLPNRLQGLDFNVEHIRDLTESWRLRRGFSRP